MTSPGRLWASRIAGWWTALAVLFGASASRGEVRHEGTWPKPETERVTVSAQALPRADAVRVLADKAGWSVVVDGAMSGSVDLQVKNQPAAKVLDLILSDGSYRARRDGELISIARVDAKINPAPAGTAPEAEERDDDDALDGVAPGPGKTHAHPPPSAPASSAEHRTRAKDRVVTGSSVRIGKDEVVGDLVVLGGSAEVLGTVNGDISVFGGSLEVKGGAHVHGDIATFGGSVELDDGARVDGDLSVLGGSLERAEHAIVGGESTVGGKSSDRDGDADKAQDHADKKRPILDLAEKIGGPVTRTALLFAFGAVLLALAGSRMDQLQREVASRPMRAFAFGVVGTLAAAVAVVALCVTILGIPIAIVAIFAIALGAYAGICAALTTLGAALLRRKTTSPYVHLAAGCALYLVFSSIPFAGRFVTWLVALIGFGALVATRAAGLIKRQGPPTFDPSYQTPAV